MPQTHGRSKRRALDALTESGGQLWNSAGSGDAVELHCVRAPVTFRSTWGWSPPHNCSGLG
jgi:hypothetical protein